MGERLKEIYRLNCILAQQFIQEIPSSYLAEENVQHKILQLQECFDLPITKESILFLENRIQSLQNCVENLKNSENQNISIEGSSYTKVKKSKGAYIPTEDKALHKDIIVPNYELPIMKKSSLREYPDYIAKDQVINVSNFSSSNLGSSHILMLSLLSFIFETLFLLLAFLFYK